MKNSNRITLLMISALVLVAFQAFAGQDHSGFVNGPFKVGQDVTKVCLECHDKQASDVMKTTHWKWKGTPNHIKGMEKSTKEYGKFNMMNSFCTTVFNGKDSKPMEGCGKCHAGYGWTGAKFDHSDKTRVDCLVCHSLKGNYERAAVSCEIDMKAIERGSMDLEKAAKNVGKPALQNCGYCHFFGGGGDAVKSPGLDSTLLNASREQDVHMAKKEKGGAGMACQDCHKTIDHKIAGASSMMAHFDARVECTDCHSGAKAPHQKSKNAILLNRHLSSVACQTCHIPKLSRGQATKVAWWWSDVGKDIEPKEEFDKETFTKKKGSFKWNMDFVPSYAWYNGKIERYLVGDKIANPSKAVVMSKPVGNIKDGTAKIYPYKLYEGSQPMDSKFKYLNTFQQYESLWKHYDWDQALKDGSQDLGLPYSGKFQFVKTVSWLAAPHEVAPKENSLQCGECHMGSKRMDWKALGYKGDPILTGGRRLTGKR